MFLSRFFFILLSSLGFFTLSFAAAVPRDWNEKYHHPRVLVPQSYYEVLRLRSTAFLNSRFIATNIVCLDRSKRIPTKDESTSLLSICPSFSTSPSATAKCGISQREVSARSGAAEIKLQAVRENETVVSLTKERWVQCVAAAREVCPTGSVEAVCVGVASRGGDVKFTLTGV